MEECVSGVGEFHTFYFLYGVLVARLSKKKVNLEHP